MGHVKNNPMMSTASGMVGDTVVFRRGRNAAPHLSMEENGETEDKANGF